MEENNFFNYEAQAPQPRGIDSAGNVHNDNGLFTGTDDNAISRWWNPGRAEQAEFLRENYMMDKGNAFNEYMFDKANEWNSANAQMERAKQAGINPMLAAAGIAGSGATATPMQSQGANLGMNTNTISPFALMEESANTIDTITGATDKLGKLIGFGKENKLNLKIAEQTAKKLAEETGKTKWERLQIQKTFKAFCRTAEANANATEQNVQNLRKLLEKYQAETELLGKQKELTEEQIRTQEHVTKQEMYKKYEMQFKDEFRRMFGVQLNDSDMSMLVQTILGGKGDKLIDAFSQMLRSIGEGIRNQLPTKEDVIDGITEIPKNVVKTIQTQIQDIINDAKVTNKHKRIENAIKYQWDHNKYLRDKYNNEYLRFHNDIIKQVHGGISGKW